MTEKEPLPQSVEVLLHTAARAATFLIFSSHTGCDHSILEVHYDHHGFQSYAVTQTASHRARVLWACMILSILCSRAGYVDADCLNFLHILVSIFRSHADCFFASRKCSEGTSYFNLSQSRRLLLQAQAERRARGAISIFRSYADCFSKSIQRLHFVYNIALCVLPFLML